VPDANDEGPAAQVDTAVPPPSDAANNQVAADTPAAPSFTTPFGASSSSPSRRRSRRASLTALPSRDRTRRPSLGVALGVTNDQVQQLLGATPADSVRRFTRKPRRSSISSAGMAEELAAVAAAVEMAAATAAAAREAAAKATAQTAIRQSDQPTALVLASIDREALQEQADKEEQERLAEAGLDAAASAGGNASPAVANAHGVASWGDSVEHGILDAAAAAADAGDTAFWRENDTRGPLGGGDSSTPVPLALTVSKRKRPPVGDVAAGSGYNVVSRLAKERERVKQAAARRERAARRAESELSQESEAGPTAAAEAEDRYAYADTLRQTISEKDPAKPKLWDLVMDDKDLGDSITSSMSYVMRGKGVPVKRSKGVDHHTRGVYVHIQGEMGADIQRSYEAARRRTTMQVFEDKGHMGKLLSVSEQRKRDEEQQAEAASKASIFGKMG